MTYVRFYLLDKHLMHTISMTYVWNHQLAKYFLWATPANFAVTFRANMYARLYTGVLQFLCSRLYSTEVDFYLKLSRQVAQLWQRDRACSIDDFKGWAVDLSLNFRLKGYVLRYYNITFTYSMYTSPIERLRRLNVAFYGIKRSVHVIVNVRPVYHRLSHPR